MSVSRKELRKGLRTNFNPGPRDYLNRLLLRSRQMLHLPAYLAGGTSTRPIFIIGAPRSGTSMLYAIMRASRELATWPGEAHEVWEADHHPALRAWDSNALDAADASEDSATRIRRSFYLVTGGHKRLLDKTPRNALRVGFVDAIFPDACYVYLQRDGRDNVNSLINAWRTPRYRTYALPEPHRIPGVDPQWWKFVLYPGWNEDRDGPLEVVCAKQWTSCNDAALAARERIGTYRWFEVRYEQFVTDPVADARRLMESLGLLFTEAVEARASAAKTTPVNVVTPPERGKWRRENPAEIANVRGLLAPTMAAMGYEFDED